MDQNAVRDGEWGQSRDKCIRWRSTCPKEKKRFWGFVVPTGFKGFFGTRARVAPLNRFRRSILFISASLALRIAEQSAYVIEMSSHVCLSAHRYCGKTTDSIRMPFAVVNGVGLGMGHSCVRWKSTCLKGKGLFLAWFSAICENSAPLISMATWRTDHGTDRFSTRV